MAEMEEVAHLRLWELSVENGAMMSNSDSEIEIVTSSGRHLKNMVLIIVEALWALALDIECTS